MRPATEFGTSYKPGSGECDLQILLGASGPVQQALGTCFTVEQISEVEYTSITEQLLI